MIEFCVKNYVFLFKFLGCVNTQHRSVVTGLRPIPVETAGDPAAVAAAAGAAGT